MALNLFSDTITFEFHKACINGDMEKVSKLLRKNDEINVSQLDEMGTLFKIVKRGDVEFVKLLLKIGLNVNQQDWLRKTPLHLACIYGLHKIVGILLENGASVNVIEGGHGRTPLLEACWKDHFDVWNDTNSSIVKMLLENGASVDTKDRYGETPLHFACNTGNLEFVQMLLDFKADVNATAQFGKTPLHNACLSGTLQVIQALLKYQPNVNAVHTDGGNYTSLIEAASVGQIEIVEELLKHGADVDYIDFEYGYGNALHAAVSNENDQIVAILLKNGCNTKVRARFICDGEEIPNCTPFELALNIESIEIAKTIAFHEN